MIQETPKIIFVDGFNTVGKDYFIKKLIEVLPSPVILTDPRVWLPVFQQSKRYWDFVYRSPDENAAVFNAHLHHLKRLRELIYETHTSVLVTNRSFVSALNYNFLPTLHNGRNIGGNDEDRQKYFDFYKSVIQDSFSDVSTLMVNLNEFHDVGDTTRHKNITELRRRMCFREPEVLMNDFYLDYLIDSYQNPAEQVKQLYTRWEDTNSGKAKELVAKYFS